jgi:hypothetical protein
LEQSDREPNRDRGPLADPAANVERATTNLRTFPHHRHAVVALGAWSARIEPRAVVFQLQHDVLALLGHRHRYVGRIRVLNGVHDALACDVEHEQGDRRGKFDVLHVPMEPDIRIASDLVRE